MSDCCKKTLGNLWLAAKKVIWPTVDMVLDLKLAHNAFTAEHPIWGSLMSTPVVASFLVTTILWIVHEKPEAKRWSWTFLLLQIWPQMKACNIIRLSYKNEAKSLRAKAKFQRQLGNIESLFEAVPQFFIKLSIIASVINRNCLLYTSPSPRDS